MFNYWNDSAHAEARCDQIREEVEEMRLVDALDTQPGLPGRLISAAGGVLVALGTRLQEQQNRDMEVPAYAPRIETLSH